MGTTNAEIYAIGGGVPLPVGATRLPVAQTFDRRLCSGTVFAPTSGTMYMTAIMLAAGTVVNAITFVSGSTGETGGTHLWFALYKQDLTFLAQAADNTGATAWAANTAFRMALTAAYTIPQDGMYYLALCCVQSAGGTPTLLNHLAASVNSNGGITGMTPILSASSSTGLNTGTAPSPAGALTAIVQSLYAFID